MQGWLFGTLAEAGIEIPEKFDLKGIVTLVLSLLGLTWNSLRARIVKHVGEPVMGLIEKGVDFIKIILTEGVGGLWKWIVAKLSDLYDMVMGQIKDFVVTKIITAGITWLISLLNPAAAFIKACKLIYDAVMWFVDNAERLKDFVDSILDSVESIASGGVGAVAGYIENTLSKMVPMLISGLASLLGLGGIADKVKGVLEKVQSPGRQGRRLPHRLCRQVRQERPRQDVRVEARQGRGPQGQGQSSLRRRQGICQRSTKPARRMSRVSALRSRPKFAGETIARKASRNDSTAPGQVCMPHWRRA